MGCSAIWLLPGMLPRRPRCASRLSTRQRFGVTKSFLHGGTCMHFKKYRSKKAPTATAAASHQAAWRGFEPTLNYKLTHYMSLSPSQPNTRRTPFLQPTKHKCPHPIFSPGQPFDRLMPKFSSRAPRAHDDEPPAPPVCASTADQLTQSVHSSSCSGSVNGAPSSPAFSSSEPDISTAIPSGPHANKCVHPFSGRPNTGGHT